MAYSMKYNIERGGFEYDTQNVKVTKRMIATPATLNQLLTNQKKKKTT
jgi:hypothetical protein